MRLLKTIKYWKFTLCSKTDAEMGHIGSVKSTFFHIMIGLCSFQRLLYDKQSKPLGRECMCTSVQRFQPHKSMSIEFSRKFQKFHYIPANSLLTLSPHPTPQTLTHFVICPLNLIYLGFYVTFDPVQVISRWVVGRAEETSTYSWSRFCTVNCQPTASNYQLSHLR